MPDARRKPRPTPALEQPLTREIRAAIADDARSPYALAKDAGIDEASLRRFISRERGLSLDSADALAVALGLQVVRKSRVRKAPRPAQARPEPGRLADATVNLSAAVAEAGPPPEDPGNPEPEASPIALAARTIEAIIIEPEATPVDLSEPVVDPEFTVSDPVALAGQQAEGQDPPAPDSDGVLPTPEAEALGPPSNPAPTPVDPAEINAGPPSGRMADTGDDATPDESEGSEDPDDPYW